MNDGGTNPNGPPHSLFDLTQLPNGGAAMGSDFFALPYPNALRLDADGTPSLANFYHQDDFIGGYVDVVDQYAHGFGPQQAIYFRWDAPLDPASLPDPAGSLTDGASAFLVDVTAGSPHRGEKIPLSVRFQAKHIDFIGDNWLALQPVQGYPPRENETYAAVVTDGARGDHGAAAAPDNLRRILDGSPQGADETAMAAAYAPLLTWLDEHQLRSHVAAATVYTTGPVTAIMDQLRDAVNAFEAPVTTDLALMTSATNYDLYTGHYNGPNFQEGDPPYTMSGGAIHLGPDGKPAPTRTESLRVAISIPKATMPAGGWPVAIYAHGTGGDYLTFVEDGTANNLALIKDHNGATIANLAVISIDQVLHGPRAPAGTDVDTAFFNFNNLIAARDNVKQGALDDFQLIRLVKSLDITSPATMKFDASRIYFFGHSQGSLTGGLYVPSDPDVKGVVYSGAGGGLIQGLLTKTQPVNIAALVQSFFRDPVDQYHPFLNILQGYFDESDPANYVSRLFVEPKAGFAPKNVYVSLGINDSYAPDPTIETFATAAGVVPINPQLLAIDAMALDGRAFVNAPVVGNVAGGVTGVVCEYNPVANSDGHFVVFEVPDAIAQSSRFLGTLAATGMARLDPP